MLEEQTATGRAQSLRRRHRKWSNARCRPGRYDHWNTAWSDPMPWPHGTWRYRWRDEPAYKPDSVHRRLTATESAIIHLRLPLPTAWCGLPAGDERAAHLRSGPEGPPLGLAPGGVYLAAMVTHRAGGLLHHRFTLTSVSRGGLLSVALSRGSPRVGVTHHLALWSPDFPRFQSPETAITRPTRPRRGYVTLKPKDKPTG